MSAFFNGFVGLCSLLYLSVLVSGHFPGLAGAASSHILLGMVTGILCVSAHCLIFAIFTGSGKDARLVVEDVGLSAEYVKRAKAFKHQVFPPALYAILLILVTTSLGGFFSARAEWSWFRYLHLGMAWLTFVYNLKTFYKEAKAVKVNASFLAELNARAANSLSQSAVNVIPELVPGAVEQFEWGAHVFALGKFLTFLGFNVWLVFLYVRGIMGLISIPVWPFVVSSVVFLVGGYYLRWSYHEFRPRKLGEVS